MSERLRLEIEAEVAEFQRIRAIARMTTGTRHMSAPDGARPMKAALITADEADAEGRRDAAREGHVFVHRDPCGRCGTRRDLHDQVGCSRWRAM